MDKQPFDHIDDQFRQAAENLSTPFKEAAWDKMEALLDQDQGKKRRPILWWWFALVGGLLLGTGVYFLVREDKTGFTAKTAFTTGPSKTPDANAAARQAATPAPGADSLSIVPPTQVLTDKPDVKTSLATAVYDRQPDRQSTGTPQTGISQKRLVPGRSKASSRAHSPVHPFRREDSIKEKENMDEPVVSTTQTEIASTAAVPDADPAYADSTKSVGADTAKVSNSSRLSPDSATLAPVKQAVSLTANEKGFYVILNGGLDAVSLRRISLHTYQPVFGGSLGYRFNSRWSIQAGFYAGKRIYTAGPNDYSIKTGSYIAKIISADADCFIYDLPLNLRYDAVTRRNSNLFVTMGLSSYLLKRETYDMHFYNASNMYRRMAYTYKGNKNFFSIYNLSIGYEQKLSRHFAVIAEPYLKLPLSGVGEGSVKLFSAGLQAGLKYQPSFRKISKK